MTLLSYRGGHDISPLSYGEEPQQALGDTLPERDNFDFLLLKYAKEKGIPILGICRGLQVINIYHGGSLYQDLNYKNKAILKHCQDKFPNQATHTVTIEKDTFLFEIFKQKEIMVNSFHHQIIHQIPTNFILSAKAKDGVVEAIEATNYRFLVGVQWHPEMLNESEKIMNRLFKKLIETTVEA